jgi:hypothetical protein
MIALQLPSALSVDNRDYSRVWPRTLQNDILLRRSILLLRMLIEEIKIATRPRCMEERKGRVDNLAKKAALIVDRDWIVFRHGGHVNRPESPRAPYHYPLHGIDKLG